MQDDLARIVHSLVAGINVGITDETVLFRLNSPVPTLLVGSPSADERDALVRYFFQNPESSRSQLVTVTYRFKGFMGVLHWMRSLVAAITRGAQAADAESAELFTAILDGDYDRASSIADSEGLEVRTLPP